jgi:hypothetical protein
MHSMVTDHEKDVDKFRREAKSAESPDVREFAARTASTLEEHLQMAKDVSAPSSATSGAGGGEPGGGK